MPTSSSTISTQVGSTLCSTPPASPSTIYSIVTKRELLGKPGLRDSERESIVAELSPCRLITLSDSIAARYSELRRRHPSLDKGDALIAAIALVKRLPLMTRNKRHFQMVAGLTLFGE